MKRYATNIGWVVGKDDYQPEELDLPLKVEIPTDLPLMFVSDYLSEEFGFFVESFKREYEIINELKDKLPNVLCVEDFDDWDGNVEDHGLLIAIAVNGIDCDSSIEDLSIIENDIQLTCTYNNNMEVYIDLWVGYEYDGNIDSILEKVNKILELIKNN